MLPLSGLMMLPLTCLLIMLPLTCLPMPLLGGLLMSLLTCLWMKLVQAEFLLPDYIQAEHFVARWIEQFTTAFLSLLLICCFLLLIDCFLLVNSRIFVAAQ
jgi:hypothetical protein